jgi:hypothetical protein
VQTRLRFRASKLIADLVWRDGSTGTVSIWLMAGLQVFGTASLGAAASNWGIFGTADFDGNHWGDILWRDSATGTVAIWLLQAPGNNISVKQSGLLGALPSNWVIAGTGDFNGDGKWDILWRDSSTGTAAIWLMDGLSILGTAALGAVPGNWVIVGTGDFNGDGLTDILWRDSQTGAVVIWIMNSVGNTVLIMQSGSLGAVPGNWVIAETGDFNADGFSDILWRDTSSGAAAIWFMGGNGLTVLQTASIGTVPTNWVIQGLNAD